MACLCDRAAERLQHFALALGELGNNYVELRFPPGAHVVKVMEWSKAEHSSGVEVLLSANGKRIDSIASSQFVLCPLLRSVI